MTNTKDRISLARGFAPLGEEMRFVEEAVASLRSVGSGFCRFVVAGGSGSVN